MKLKELLQCELVKDRDTVTIEGSKAGKAGAIRKGHWFNDQIAELGETRVMEFAWGYDTGWIVRLEEE